MTLPPKETEQIKINIVNASTKARIGEINQLKTVKPNFPQFIFYEPTLASPAPISAPTTVWVPLIGIPKIDATKIKLNEAKHVPSMILS